MSTSAPNLQQMSVAQLRELALRVRTRAAKYCNAVEMVIELIEAEQPEEKGEGGMRVRSSKLKAQSSKLKAQSSKLKVQSSKREGDHLTPALSPCSERGEGEEKKDERGT